MAVPFGMSPAHSRFGLLVSTVVPGFALALASLMRSRMALCRSFSALWALSRLVRLSRLPVLS